jgi:hypothetical protein
MATSCCSRPPNASKKRRSGWTPATVTIVLSRITRGPSSPLTRCLTPRWILRKPINTTRPRKRTNF